MEKADLDLVLAWRNSARIRQAMFSEAVIIQEAHYKWFDGLAQDNSVHLIFEFQGRPVGVSNFKAIDAVNSRCLWGFYLGEPDLPRGVGLILGVHSLDYAFAGLSVEKLCSEVLADNPTSLNYHLRLGFTQEGLFKKHIKKESGFIDVIALAQFKTDWEQFRSSIIDDLANKY